MSSVFLIPLKMSFRINKRKSFSAQASSTLRRARLAELIADFGEVMPTKCTPCRDAGRVCRVHVKSGRCGACNSSNNSRCDIRITSSEFRRLIKERTSLKEKLRVHREELDAARLALEAAHERYSVALSKEGRLLKQMEYNETKAAEAITVEERGIQEQEVEEFSAELDLESFEPFPFDDRLLMEPVQWESLTAGSSSVGCGSGGASLEVIGNS